VRRLISCGLLIAIMMGYALPADAAKRVALVIGNAAYRNVGPLANPANDSKAVAAALRRLGFVVIEAVDQDRAGMQGLGSSRSSPATASTP
jgi:Caspase domain